VSNKLSSNPLNIDTPSSTVPIVKTAYKIKHIEFVGFAADTDSCIVTDVKGNIITEMLGASAGGDGVVRTGNVGWVDGIMVTTLTSGLCLIFFE
jgi:hypothetical protein